MSDEQEQLADLNTPWLLITVSTAGGSPSLRVYVWRRLRLLGALYLQQSVCILPAVPTVRKEINRFVDRVRHDGGSVRTFSFQVTDQVEHKRLLGEFNQARNEEYAEILERTPSFLDELEMERRRGRTTYAEVEESEADLERFHSWLNKIVKRDYFAAPKGAEARAAVERCALEFAAFEAAALTAETPTTEPLETPDVAHMLKALNASEFASDDDPGKREA